MAPSVLPSRERNLPRGPGGGGEVPRSPWGREGSLEKGSSLNLARSSGLPGQSLSTFLVLPRLSIQETSC